MDRRSSDDAQPLARKSAPSSVERAKKASRHLRGTIVDELANPSSGFTEPAAQVLKFHGMYQQEDRDLRAIARRGGAGRSYNLMLRVRIPAGTLTADQYIALDSLADDVVYNRSIRITTRQNVQLHGILKTNLRSAIRRIDDALLTTLSGCGDVERNVVAPPAPLRDTPHRQLRSLAQELTAALTPSTNAYREVWLDGELVDSDQETEPLYGDSYLPRKFKTGLALPDDDSIAVRGQDLGLIGIVAGDRIARYNVVVGGGGGLTHRRKDTYARLATPLGSIEAGDAVALARAVAGVFRDFGDRTDRKHARLKYLVEEWGIDRFRRALINRVDFTIAPWVQGPPLRTRNWLGIHAQGDGFQFYGLPLPSGRIADTQACRLKTAMRVAVETLRPEITLTPQQNVILGALRPSDLATLEGIFRGFRVPISADLSPLRRNALACPSLPTCGLALAEAERVAPEVLAEIEAALEAAGMSKERVDVSLTGCPNGCARPYNAEVGLVGRKPNHYDIFVGGSSERMGVLYAEQVTISGLTSALQPLLDLWSAERDIGEALGDFFLRTFTSTRRTDILTGEKTDPALPLVEQRSQSLGLGRSRDVA